MSHPSSDLCTGSRLINALKINSSHSPTKFSLPANLTTCPTQSYLCSVYRYNSLLVSCHPSSTICIFIILNHQRLFQICITLHVETGKVMHKVSSFLHSVNLILVFTLLLVHLILHTSYHIAVITC